MKKITQIQDSNGAKVIGITKGSNIKDMTSLDSRSILNTENFANTTTNLGMLNMFENMRIVKVPFLKDIYANHDVVTVNGGRGSFTYEVPLDITPYTLIEVVSEGEVLGIDGSTFEIKTSHPFKQRDILKTHIRKGVQLEVANDYDVIDTGDGFIHTVTLATDDREAYVEASDLSTGMQIFKIGDSVGEYDTSLSGLTGFETGNSMQLKYQIGSMQGVEVTWTDEANSIRLNNSTELKGIMAKAHQLSSDVGSVLSDNYVTIAPYNKETKRYDKSKMKVEKLLKILAIAELYKMLSMRMLFADGYTITGVNASTRVNDGIYPQMRRGNHYLYSNVAELRNVLKIATDKVFQGNNIATSDRKIKFKVGFEAEQIVRGLFKDEFTNTTPISLTADSMNHIPILSGKDRYNQDFQSFAIGSAFLNGIGHVTLEHDPSMDYDFGDVLQSGFVNGRSENSYSLIIQDITDPTYSNVASKLPDGVTFHNKAQKKNLYLIKKEGQTDIAYGQENGRIYGQGVTSSMAHAGSNFWCKGQVDAWIPDLSRVVLIEKA